MSEIFLPIKKVAEIYGNPSFKNHLEDLAKQNKIPKLTRKKCGALFKKGWHINELPMIGEKIGFLSFIITISKPLKIVHFK